MTDLTKPRGRIVALDPGERRVGVAVSNSDRTMAFPRTAIANDDNLLKAIHALVVEEDAAAIVIGLPRLLNGKEGASAKQARLLAGQIEEQLKGLGVSVDLHDERLTTVTAQTALREAGLPAREQRQYIDSAAATVLLESWCSCQM